MTKLTSDVDILRNQSHSIWLNAMTSYRIDIGYYCIQWPGVINLKDTSKILEVGERSAQAARSPNIENSM